MPSDTNLEIRLKASVDSSLAASTRDVVDRLNELVEQADKASSDIKSKLAQSAKTDDAQPRKKPDHSADDGARIEQEIAQKRIEGAQRVNASLLSMGEESLEQFKAQAIKLENDRYQIALDGAARRKSASGKGGEGDEAAKAELAEVEHQNRLSAIDVEYSEKKRAADRAATEDFIKSKESELNQALAGYARQYQAGQIDADQRHALETGLTSSVEQEILNRLAADDAGLAEGTQAYENAMRQRDQITASFNARLKASTDALNREQAQSWAGVVSKIDSAEGELVNDIFTKRQSLQRDLAQVGERMLQQEVQNDIKAFTNKLLYNQLGAQSDKATAQEGLLFKLASYLFDKSSFQATETAKNQAAATGQALRNDTTEAGMSQGISSVFKAATQIIGADAGQAAAGAQASASQIPYVGWLIAPAAAASAFAEVLSFAKFDAGADLVPSDMIAMIHAGERIVPKADNAAIMSAIRGGGPGGSGDTYHLNLTDSRTYNGADMSARDLLRSDPHALFDMIHAGVRAGHLKLATR